MHTYSKWRNEATEAFPKKWYIARSHFLKEFRVLASKDGSRGSETVSFLFVTDATTRHSQVL